MKNVSLFIMVLLLIGLVPISICSATSVENSEININEDTEIQGDYGGESQITVTDEATLTVDGNVTMDLSDVQTQETEPTTAIELDSGNLTITGDLIVEGDQGLFISGGNSSAEIDGSVKIETESTDVAAVGVEINRPRNEADYMEPAPGPVNVEIGGDLEVSGPVAVGVEAVSSGSTAPAENNVLSPVTIKIDGDLTVEGSIPHPISETTGVYMRNNGHNPTGLYLQASQGDITVQTGDLTVKGADSAVGVEYFVQGGNELNISTGDINTTGVYSIYGDAWNPDTQALINVDGDVNGEVAISTRMGATTELNITGSANYIHANSDGSETKVTIGEDASAHVFADSDGTFDLHIKGDAVSNDSNPALLVGANNTGEVDIIVDKNVEGDIQVYDMGGTVNISVSGDVTGSISIASNTGSSEMDIHSEVDILIDGTLSSEKTPIVIEDLNSKDKLQLTVWEVNLDGSDSIVTAADSSMISQETVEKVEKNILYIIRVEQPTEGGDVSLSGVAQSHGFDVAKEGETITVQSALQDGYRVAGVFNNGAALTLQDNDGNYYLIVPKGGGVLLTFKTEKYKEAKQEEEHINSSSDSQTQNTTSEADNNNDAGKRVNLKEVNDTNDTNKLKKEIENSVNREDVFGFLPEAIKIMLPKNVSKITDMSTVSLNKNQNNAKSIVFNIKKRRNFKADEKVSVMIALPDNNGRYTYLVLEGRGLNNGKLEIPIASSVGEMLAGHTFVVMILE